MLNYFAILMRSDTLNKPHTDATVYRMVYPIPVKNTCFSLFHAKPLHSQNALNICCKK